MDEGREGTGDELQAAETGDILSNLRTAIVRLESGTASRDEFLTCMNFRDRAKEMLTLLCKQVDSSATQWLVENGEVQEGDIRYYVGPTKTTKCTDQKKALGAILEATGGDLDKLAECFASGAFKHGFCKNVLAEDVYKGVFETTEKLDLFTGKPLKGMHKVNMAFMPKGK